MQSDLDGGILKTDFLFLDPKQNICSPSLKSLVQSRNCKVDLDEEFFNLYLAKKDTWPLTPVKGIIKAASSSEEATASPDLFQNITSSFTEKIGEDLHVALSGGLDSQFLILLARELGFNVTAHYLKTEIPAYCEQVEAFNFCKKFSVRYNELKATKEDFITHHVELTQLTQWPVYNLHPVSKLLMAKELWALGITKIYSGDGADQVMAGATYCDLFRLTQQCFESQNIDLVTPFATAAVKKWVHINGPFKDKEPLRDLARKKWNLAAKPKAGAVLPELYSATTCIEQSRKYLKAYLCAE